MKIIGLLSCGRSGADLFQSLLDSHEEILQFPGYLIFDSKLFNILSITNKREIAKKFCEEYPQFFDSRINKEERHHQLGPKKNDYFLVNKKKFIENFKKNGSTKGGKFQTLISLNKSYYEVTKRPIKKIKIVMIHFHLFFNFVNFQKKFDNNVRITIVLTLRDILASLSSTCYKWSRYKPKALDAHTLYLNMLSHIKQIFRLKRINKKIFVIQMEKLHTENDKVMRDFCKIFNIRFKKSLSQSTYFGKKWWGDQTSLKYLNGINPKFKNNFYGEYFFKKDISLIEKKISRLLLFYDYPFRSNIRTSKILDLLPYKFEYLIWKNSFKKFNVKQIIKIPFYWLIRIFNLFNDNIYNNFSFPYSIGSGNYKSKK